MGKKKVHIVLDLDNTLIQSRLSRTKKPPDFEINVAGEHYYVYKRPGLDKFIMNLFDNAKSVSVWTAATKDYCNQILKNIFTNEERKKLRFVWSRNKTINRDGYWYLKDMNRVFQQVRYMKPWNTLLLDDNPDHFVVSPNNVLGIKPWNGDRKDCELSKVSNLLQRK